MTIPLERSRAVLWAGSLLIALNGDRRVPMPYRTMATAIARHFPTVEDGLAGMAFIETAVKSGKAGAKWVRFPKY